MLATMVPTIFRVSTPLVFESSESEIEPQVKNKKSIKIKRKSTPK